jgi:hypothetical protein
MGVPVREIEVTLLLSVIMWQVSKVVAYVGALKKGSLEQGGITPVTELLK